MATEQLEKRGDHRSGWRSIEPRISAQTTLGLPYLRDGLMRGRVDYQPNPVDAPADGNVLICCSQPEGDIVIDL
jgi:hypothetical protein